MRWRAAAASVFAITSTLLRPSSLAWVSAAVSKDPSPPLISGSQFSAKEDVNPTKGLGPGWTVLGFPGSLSELELRFSVSESKFEAW